MFSKFESIDTKVKRRNEALKLNNQLSNNFFVFLLSAFPLACFACELFFNAQIRIILTAIN